MNNSTKHPQKTTQVFNGSLVDGSLPTTSDHLLAMLDAFDIQHSTVTHAPMKTVADAKALRNPSKFGHTKNLFLKNKQHKMWLLTLHEDRHAHLKQIAEMLGTKQLSFASPERLGKYLGVTPGAVSAFSMINDISRQVEFYIDAELLTHQTWHVHPLINTRTTTIERTTLLAFLAKHGIQHTRLKFDIEIN